MATNFPGAIDNATSLPYPTSGNFTNGPSLAGGQDNQNDAIIATQTKLGSGASTPTNNNLLIGTGTGTSAWSKAAPTGTIVGTSDTQTLTNKTLTAPTINNPVISNATISADVIAGFTTSNTGTVYGVPISGGQINGSSITTGGITNTQIANNTIISNNINWTTSGGIWWEEIGRTTLSTAGDGITVSSLPVRKYIKVMYTIIPTGGTTNALVQFNSDTGANYSVRASGDGGVADGVAVSQTSVGLSTATASIQHIGEFFGHNIAGQEKFLMGETVGSTPGASNSINRRTYWFKWANTSNAITSVKISNTGTGDFAAGSEIVVLGHD